MSDQATTLSRPVEPRADTGEAQTSAEPSSRGAVSETAKAPQPARRVLTCAELDLLA